jgi:hypothetical protein
VSSIEAQILDITGLAIDQQYLLNARDMRWIPEATVLGRCGMTEETVIHLPLLIWKRRYTER